MPCILNSVLCVVEHTYVYICMLFNAHSVNLLSSLNHPILLCFKYGNTVFEGSLKQNISSLNKTLCRLFYTSSINIF